MRVTKVIERSAFWTLFAVRARLPPSARVRNTDAKIARRRLPSAWPSSSPSLAASGSASSRRTCCRDCSEVGWGSLKSWTPSSFGSVTPTQPSTPFSTPSSTTSSEKLSKRCLVVIERRHEGACTQGHETDTF